MFKPVSVIIPAYAVERMPGMEKAVESILNQTYQPFEVIISVDHNEALLDELTNFCNKYGGTVKSVLNYNILGGAETRNVGMRAAIGEIVAFTDDDAWADGSWLENLIKWYDDPKVLAVGGKTVSVWGRGRPAWFPEELDWLVGGTWKGHPSGPCEVRNLIGPNMSFRREVCDHIGYMLSDLGAYGHGFRAGDETEFFIRMKRRFPEHKILFDPDAVIYHEASRHKSTFGQLCLRSYSLGYYKSKMTKVLLESTDTPFEVENSFLLYLLRHAIPEKIRSLKAKQAISITTSMLFTGLGYAVGKV